jgi:type IV secretory pathway TrbL component
MSEFLVVENVVLQGLIIIVGTILGTLGGILLLQIGGQCKAKLS